eukprot:359155-Chlamydomonas_euryale.AAC.11
MEYTKPEPNDAPMLREGRTSGVARGAVRQRDPWGTQVQRVGGRGGAGGREGSGWRTAGVHVAGAADASHGHMRTRGRPYAGSMQSSLPNCGAVKGRGAARCRKMRRSHQSCACAWLHVARARPRAKHYPCALTPPLWQVSMMVAA